MVGDEAVSLVERDRSVVVGLHVQQRGGRTERRAPVEELGQDGGGQTATSLGGVHHERLEEQPFLEWATDYLVESGTGSGQWVLPDGPGELPLMFSLLASKPV